MRRGAVVVVGCGYVGGALAARLAAEGRRVIGVSRAPEGLAPGVEPLAADVSRPATLRALPGDAEALVYAVSAGERSDAAYRTAYVEGPRHVLRALAARGTPLRVVLYVSSTAVYAQADGQPVDEASPTRPDDFGGRRLLEGERAVLDGPYRGVVLRLGGIYGPGRTSLVDRVREGTARFPVDPPLWSNRIHRDDAAGALARLLEAPPGVDVVLGVDDEPAPMHEVVAWLAARLGVPVPPPGEPSTGSRALRTNKRCLNRRLRELGYRFRYPSYRDGYAALLDVSP